MGRAGVKPAAPGTDAGRMRLRSNRLSAVLPLLAVVALAVLLAGCGGSGGGGSSAAAKQAAATAPGPDNWPYYTVIALKPTGS